MNTRRAVNRVEIRFNFFFFFLYSLFIWLSITPSVDSSATATSFVRCTIDVNHRLCLYGMCEQEDPPYCPVIGSENKGVVLLFALQTKLCWSNLYLDGPVYIVIPIVQKYYVGGGELRLSFLFHFSNGKRIKHDAHRITSSSKKFTVVSNHRIREKWQMNSSLAGKPHFHFQPCFICHYDSTLFVSIMQRVLWTLVSYVKRQLRERICNISLYSIGWKGDVTRVTQRRQTTRRTNQIMSSVWRIGKEKR